MPVAADDASDEFGYSVAVSGDTLVVGASFEGGQVGAAYVFDRNQGGADTWGQVKKLTASDGAADDQFGASVILSGNTLVAGALAKASSTGAAYVFALEPIEVFLPVSMRP